MTEPNGELVSGARAIAGILFNDDSDRARRRIYHYREIMEGKVKVSYPIDILPPLFTVGGSVCGRRTSLERWRDQNGPKPQVRERYGERASLKETNTTMQEALIAIVAVASSMEDTGADPHQTVDYIRKLASGAVMGQ